MKKTDFDVMSQMVRENKKIKATTTITELKMVKAGGKITFGIDKDTYHDVSKSFGLGIDTHYVIAYIIDKKEFDEIKES